MTVPLLMVATMMAMDSPLCEHPGASLVFVSEHAVAVEFRSMAAEGAFRECETLLDTAADSNDPHVRQLVAEGRDLLNRMRREYSLDAREILDKVRESIPDLTPADIERWRVAGELQYRLIDGEVKYFKREPSNLFRFCPEAIERRDKHRDQNAKPQEKSESKWTLQGHLEQIVQAADGAGSPIVFPVKHHMRYAITVRPDQVGGRSGSRIRAWLPFPQVYRQQQHVRLVSASPEAYRMAPVAPDPFDGSVTAHRTVYFEHDVRNLKQPVHFAIEFEFLTHAYYPDLDDTRAKALRADHMREHLCERPPHIRFSKELRERVERVIGEETNPLAKARLIFDDVATGIRYCAEEEYSTLPGFAEKAMRTGRGDCGVQTMLFITMCRAAGIPARWQSGFQTHPGSWNLHDWAEFYVEPWGWLPADVSYGYTTSEDPRIRNFYFGHQDAYRLIVNMDYGFPLYPTKHSLRSEPADFQRGEVEIDGRNLYFHEWDWDLDLRTELPQ